MKYYACFKKDDFTIQLKDRKTKETAFKDLKKAKFETEIKWDFAGVVCCNDEKPLHHLDNIDKGIVMAFTDPVDALLYYDGDSDEDNYKYFTDDFTGNGIHTYYFFNTPDEFIETWHEIEDKPCGMWYWCMENGDCFCSGAKDPGDIDIFMDYFEDYFERIKKVFLIEYTESYCRTYAVAAESYDEACEKLTDALLHGNVEAPDECYDSGYNVIQVFDNPEDCNIDVK